MSDPLQKGGEEKEKMATEVTISQKDIFVKGPLIFESCC